ncbi:MAG: hypothetical protein F9K24_00150 [Leptonema illini]|uniref:DUF6285 domain-containing protein n=1 Tax=Leptonema illini TaxID=183 RepID=A0A833H4G3_9LEPT|nr:MAG: hypothetical protein F9K24_00150 [Leptonema illini]
MQDKPKAEDLLEAVQDFLMKEILPEIRENDLLAYKTLVSWNMLGVISREIKSEEETITAELERMAPLLGEKIPTGLSFQEKRNLLGRLTSDLAEKIRNERIVDTGSLVWKTVKESVAAKLRVSNPRFQADE